MLNKIFPIFVSCIITFSHLLSNDVLMDQGIKHVVVVMLENRSFDNVLAWLYEHDAPHYFLPENTDPQFKGLSEDTLDLYTNDLKNANGDIVFSSPPIKGVPSVINSSSLNSPQFNPNEPFPNVTNQIFGFDGSTSPKMLGFLQDYASLWKEQDWLKEKKTICSVMETYTENEMPVLYGLAKHYAVSDEWFSSVPTQTNPNRAFFMCGTSNGQTINGNLGLSIFHSDTLWNRIVEESPDTTWNIFWQSEMLQGIIEKPASGSHTFMSLELIPDFGSHFLKMDKFHELARDGQLPAVSFLEPQWTLSENMSPTNPPLFNIDDLIFGLQGNDLHPPGDIRSGENFLANIYTSLIANPEAWNQTLFVVTFDEHGGLFDHVPPPAATSPDNECQEGFKFDRFGVRVPTIFISPKINRRTVIRSNTKVPFDHTSFMATVFKWLHIDKKRWNMGNRTRKAPTFESVITLEEPRSDTAIIPDNINLAQVSPENVVYMGESFYLKDKDGAYILQSKEDQIPNVGQGEKAILRFANGSGKITHGSFVLIKVPELADNKNILGAHSYKHNCYFTGNEHNSTQWWTIKSVDHPYVGYEIQYGEKIFLENHVYTDIVNYAPARLAKKQGWLNDYLSTKSVIQNGNDDDYWILEKPVEDNLVTKELLNISTYSMSKFSVTNNPFFRIVSGQACS